MEATAPSNEPSAEPSTVASTSASQQPSAAKQSGAPAEWHVAQVNIGTLVDDDDSETVAEFMNNLDRINALAEATPGFVWRLTGDGNDATDLKLWDDPRRIINVSVWETVDALKDFTYTSEHAEFFRRRGDWFVSGQSQLALWWVAAGTQPTAEDAKRRAESVAANGPTPDAFTFGRRFDPPPPD